MPTIREAKILIMATDGFEQAEFLIPLRKLKQAGASVRIAAPRGPTIRGWNEKDWGDSVAVDLTLDAVSASDFHCLVLPGGVMNPDKLRMNDAAIDVVQDFLDAGRIVAAICHAPWLLIEADAVDGCEMTSFPSIRTDIENAGGQWVDRPVVVDDTLITSRSPKDLDAFVAKIIEEIEAREQLGDETLRHNA